MEALETRPINLIAESDIAMEATAAEYASTVMGATVAPGLLPAELAESCQRALSRAEEIGAPRDKWGNWEGPAGKPGATFHRATLDREIIARAGQAGISRHSIWPGGAGWAMCLTHDLDFVSRYARWRETGIRLRRLCQIGAGFGRTARRVGGGLLRSAGGLRSDPWWCYEKWIKLAADAGAPSTWFVFPQHVAHPHVYDSAYSYDHVVRYGGRRMTVREMLRAIAAAGMEIGLHPSIHAARDSTQLLQQRREVEDAAGCEVTSVRQHYLRWDADCTPVQQSVAGLKVDSTLGFNCGIGFRTGGCFPYRMPGPTTELIEVPMQIMDIALFSHAGLAARSADEAVAACMTIMEEVQSVGGVLVLNWHPHTITDDAMLAVVRALLAEGKRRHAWFATLKGVAEHWKVRCPQRIEPSGIS